MPSPLDSTRVEPVSKLCYKQTAFSVNELVLGLTSHYQLGLAYGPYARPSPVTGPWFKVPSERLDEVRTEPATLDLLCEHAF